MKRMDTTRRPYALLVMGDSARGTRQAPEPFPLADARVLAGIYRIAPVAANVPRSSVRVPTGLWVELRYVDPRPGAPECIAPRSQIDS